MWPFSEQGLTSETNKFYKHAFSNLFFSQSQANVFFLHLSTFLMFSGDIWREHWPGMVNKQVFSRFYKYLKTYSGINSQRNSYQTTTAPAKFVTAVSFLQKALHLCLHIILSKGEVYVLTCKHSGRPMSPRTASIASAWSARKSLYLFANPLNNKSTKWYKFIYCAIKMNLAKCEND